MCVAHAHALDLRAQHFRERHRILGVAMRNDDGELLAAVACGQIARAARMVPQGARYQPQALVARDMPIVVVV